jgi:hypothetical protein
MITNQEQERLEKKLSEQLGRDTLLKELFEKPKEYGIIAFGRTLLSNPKTVSRDFTGTPVCSNSSYTVNKIDNCVLGREVVQYNIFNNSIELREVVDILYVARPEDRGVR